MVNPPPAVGTELGPGFLVNVKEEDLESMDSMVRSTAPLERRIVVKAQDELLTVLDATTISKTASDVVANYQATQNSSRVGLWSSRAEGLIANFLFWNWIEDHVTCAWFHEGTRPSTTQASSKITQLFVDLRQMHKNRPCSKPFDAANYLEGFSIGEAIHQIEYKHKSFFIRSAVDECEEVVDIIASWLKIEKQDRKRAQAWVVRELVARVGAHALTIEPVQLGLAYSISEKVFGLGKNRKVRFTQVDDWATQFLAKHPLSNPQSRIASLAESIFSGISTCAPLNPNLISRLDAVDLKAAAPWSRLADLTPIATISTTTMPLLAPPAQQSQALDSTIPNKAAFDSFFKSIAALMPFVETPGFEPPNKQPGWTRVQKDRNKYLWDVYNGSDKKLPFRDLAKSRRVILQPGGPYSPENLHTIPGFFSALIYRGVTHNTKFLWNQQSIFFNDLDDWKKEGATDDIYFCNQAAYGQTARARLVGHVDRYWELLNTDGGSWRKWFEAEQPQSIEVAHRSIAHIFPAFGELTAAQIAIDYAVAGKLKMPTMPEMARLIHRLQLGAMDGLKALGYTLLSTPQDIQKALESITHEFEQRMTPDELVSIDFGPIFLEHALCKLGRLDHKPWQNYYSHLV